MKIHYNIKILGDVQGVFFRDFAKKFADELFIRGFVKNMPDHSVYIEAEGEEQNIKKFLERLKIGPQYGHVSEVETKEDKHKDFTDFEIIYSS